MIKLIKIQGLSETYPVEIEGTHEWYAAREPGMDMCDLYEAEEIFEKTGSFKGMNYHLIHYPDGEVHSPFQLQENVYVDKPVWNDGVLNFLVVDFKKKLIIITEYIPVKKELRVIAELSLSEVEDCYNLMLETSPLMLGRSPHDGYYEIVWPENKRIPIGDTETFLFRDGEHLYFSEWYEDPVYRENVIVREIHTGKIIEKSKGYILRLPNNVYWKT